MSEWRALHAFSTSLDALLLDVVGPFFERNDGTMDHGFWERHYAGGPHVRIRLRAPAALLDERLTALRQELEAWLTSHPAPRLESYSEERAARVLHKEGVDVETEELTYRNGVVVERPYPERKRFLSPEARELVENFRRARGPLALHLLRGSASPHESALKLYFTLALFVGAGRYPPGSVSFKSHWEHFSATLSSDELRRRIQESYVQRRARVLALLEDVKRGWEKDRFADDPALGPWWRLIEWAYEQAARMLRKGHPLIYRPTSPEAIAAGRAGLYGAFGGRSNEFVETMWSDDEFASAVQYDLPFQLSRALVNLLYDLIAALGLRPLDKIAFCYCAFRAVEDACSCNLTDLMRSNMVAVVQRQAHRASEKAP